VTGFPAGLPGQYGPAGSPTRRDFAPPFLLLIMIMIRSRIGDVRLRVNGGRPGLVLRQHHHRVRPHADIRVVAHPSFAPELAVVLFERKLPNAES